ncbi:nucleotidyltransferase domain-containing protein [Acidobacteria bacterium AH-259-D05]|nr:nucleotidyltransferase domain-containing protein [Acidobacteria bacterium AH-259-D05]
MPVRSSNSVVVKSADQETVKQAVERYADRLRREHPEVKRFIWFGSWVSGLPGPRSDVDLCIVVSSSDERLRDRVAKYLPSCFPTGMDLIVYTVDELERLREDFPQWYATITSGVDI